MELKERITLSTIAGGSRFNRTFMELKEVRVNRCYVAAGVSIAPLWN